MKSRGQGGEENEKTVILEIYGMNRSGRQMSVWWKLSGRNERIISSVEGGGGVNEEGGGRKFNNEYNNNMMAVH